MRCLYCKKRLGLFRFGQRSFCSEEHETLYKEAQAQEAIQRLMDPFSGARQKAPAGAKPAKGDQASPELVPAVVETESAGVPQGLEAAPFVEPESVAVSPGLAATPVVGEKPVEATSEPEAETKSPKTKSRKAKTPETQPLETKPLETKPLETKPLETWADLEAAMSVTGKVPVNASKEPVATGSTVEAGSVDASSDPDAASTLDLARLMDSTADLKSAAPAAAKQRILAEPTPVSPAIKYPSNSNEADWIGEVPPLCGLFRQRPCNRINYEVAGVGYSSEFSSVRMPVRLPFANHVPAESDRAVVPAWDPSTCLSLTSVRAAERNEPIPTVPVSLPTPFAPFPQPYTPQRYIASARLQTIGHQGSCARDELKAHLEAQPHTYGAKLLSALPVRERHVPECGAITLRLLEPLPGLSPTLILDSNAEPISATGPVTLPAPVSVPAPSSVLAPTVVIAYLHTSEFSAQASRFKESYLHALPLVIGISGRVPAPGSLPAPLTSLRLDTQTTIAGVEPVQLPPPDLDEQIDGLIATQILPSAGDARDRRHASLRVPRHPFPKIIVGLPENNEICVQEVRAIAPHLPRPNPSWPHSSPAWVFELSSSPIGVSEFVTLPSSATVPVFPSVLAPAAVGVIAQATLGVSTPAAVGMIAPAPISVCPPAVAGVVATAAVGLLQPAVGQFSECIAAAVSPAEDRLRPVPAALGVLHRNPAAAISTLGPRLDKRTLPANIKTVPLQSVEKQNDWPIQSTMQPSVAVIPAATVQGTIREVPVFPPAIVTIGSTWDQEQWPAPEARSLGLFVSAPDLMALDRAPADARFVKSKIRAKQTVARLEALAAAPSTLSPAPPVWRPRQEPAPASHDRVVVVKLAPVRAPKRSRAFPIETLPKPNRPQLSASQAEPVIPVRQAAVAPAPRPYTCPELGPAVEPQRFRPAALMRLPRVPASMGVNALASLAGRPRWLETSLREGFGDYGKPVHRHLPLRTPSLVTQGSGAGSRPLPH